MSSSFNGFVLDPSKCDKLNMEEKRELVYEISKWSHGAPEMLQSWSRRELLQILCAEMGKERKYTGLTKIKMIEHLLKIVSEKKNRKHVDGTDLESESSPANSQSTSKRQRKTDNPSRLPNATNYVSISNGNGDLGNTTYCQNSACRATVHQEDAFCKRCSCCICYQYDDNKDPSLWLFCSSEPPYQGDSCGMSCHLECALKHERAWIAKEGHHGRLDGSFYCVHCGKVNDLLGCWRKQMVTARDTRRVEILCYRVSLSQKLLSGTEKYKKLHEIVDTAAKTLEAEVGLLAGLPVKSARGIVNRLSSGPEVQKLCAFAVESLDMMLSCNVLHPLSNPNVQDSSLISPRLVRFEDICSTSISVVLGSEVASSSDHVMYILWHRKADATDHPAEPTCSLSSLNTRFSVLDLAPATDYLFKVVSLCDERELGMWEVRITTRSAENDISKSLALGRSQSPVTNGSSVSNPSSEGDESNNITAYRDPNNEPPCTYYSCCRETDKANSGKLSDDGSKDVSDSHNTSTGMGQEEMPGDSISALDEERVMEEVRSVPDSTIQLESQRDSTNSTDGNLVSDIPKLENKLPPEARLVKESTDNGLNSRVRKEMEIVPFGCGSNAVLPITPCKPEIGKDVPGRSGRPKSGEEELDHRSGNAEEPQAGSSSKKKGGTRWDDGCTRDGSLEREYEYCVKIIRRLECEGHIEKNFRVKFLTWYSLRATSQERRIVKVFVDTLIDDPACLAGQLVDTFSEGISSKRPSPLPSGFCMKLWH